jgi:AcrR family transcriptional regulator
MFRLDVQSKSPREKRQPHQLPPGRHGLPRSFVVSNQRERILSAVAYVTSAASYAEMSVEDIIVTAGVSRRTFYEHFKNKEDVYLAAYDAVSAQLVEQVVAAMESAETFADQCAAGLRAFLEFGASEPAFARMCIVEVLAAGPEAIKRRNDTMQAFATLIHTKAEELLEGKIPPPLTAETVVGGIYEVVYTRVLRGEIAELPRLLPDLIYSSLLPYLGVEAARKERARLAEAKAA